MEQGEARDIDASTDPHLDEMQLATLYDALCDYAKAHHVEFFEASRHRSASTASKLAR